MVGSAPVVTSGDWRWNLNNFQGPILIHLNLLLMTTIGNDMDMVYDMNTLDIY